MTAEFSRRFVSYLPRALPWTMWPTLALLVCYVYLHASITANYSAEAFLISKIVELEPRIEEVTMLEAQRDRLLARLEAVAELRTQQSDVLNLLNVLSRSDEGVSISVTQFSTNRLDIAGQVSEADRFPDFVRLLESYQFSFDGESDVYEMTKRSFRLSGQWRSYDDNG